MRKLNTTSKVPKPLTLNEILDQLNNDFERYFKYKGKSPLKGRPDPTYESILDSSELTLLVSPRTMPKGSNE